MASIVLPKDPIAGQEFTHNDKTLVFNDGVWTILGGSGGSGGLDEAAVNALIDAKIEALNLGNIVTANMFTSTDAPDNSLGNDGDIWAQVPV